MNNSKGGFMWRFLEFINKWLYCYYDMGKLHIRSSGEYRVPLHFTPREVYVAFDEDDDYVPGVCNADPDGFDVRVVPKGFVVTVDLKSEKRKLRWVAVRG